MDMPEGHRGAAALTSQRAASWGPVDCPCTPGAGLHIQQEADVHRPWAACSVQHELSLGTCLSRC